MGEKIAECYADCLPYLIDKASVYLRSRGSIYIKSLGLDLTIEQYIALDAIAAADNLCQRDLAKVLLKDRSNVTRILSILEKKGLIQRVTSTKQNRPVKLLKITNEGRKLTEKYMPVVKQDLKNFLDSFDDRELEQFKQTLEKIISKISEKTNIQI